MQEETFELEAHQKDRSNQENDSEPCAGHHQDLLNMVKSIEQMWNRPMHQFIIAKN